MSQSLSNVFPIHGGQQENVLPQPHELADPNIANALGLIGSGLVGGFICIDGLKACTGTKKSPSIRSRRAKAGRVRHIYLNENTRIPPQPRLAVPGRVHGFYSPRWAHRR